MRRTLTLPLGVLLLLAAGSCGGGVSGPDGGRPILGDCDVVPNYVPQVILNRWRQFPLRYHVIESTLPMEDRDWILERIVDGIHRWSTSTNGRVGSLSATSSPDGADFVIVVEDLGMVVAARTTHTTGAPFLAGGRIVFDRETVVRLAELESEVLAALAAHEMGHLLGIIGHPTTRGVLMRVPLEADRPTETDVNTMGHAYCR